ncbi:MAG: carboxylating nicotinate-nucleotide diphosphorylase [Nitrospirae bacterium]|nr:carboxylating nicotinate-nucleotide diphosphorylase [Nitrospirota bacterium]
MIRSVIIKALEEDIGHGDITTSAIIRDGIEAKGLIIAKEDLVLAGVGVASECFKTLDPKIIFKGRFGDGNKVKAGKVIAEVKGNAQTILMAERVALNFLQRLSGIATLTSKYVEKIKGTKAKIVDTRKTTPGRRSLEKYAVRMGGGFNHRFGLYDAILIKDNHIALSGSIRKAVEKTKGKTSHTTTIEVEAKSLKEVKDALQAGVDIIMLDNMDLETTRKAVKLIKGKALIEASGNINLDNVREMAKTGVDLISIGALTHSAPAVDISLGIEPL